MDVRVNPLSAPVPNSSLATSSLTIAGHSVSLGGSQTLAASDLSDTTAPTSYAPVLTFGGGSTGITYHANNKGVYCSVGKMVTYQFNLQLTSKGSSTGQALIALPRDIDASAFFGSGVCSGFINFTTAFGVFLLPGAADASHINVYYVPAGGGSSGASNTEFANNTNLICAITYVSV